MAGNKRNYMPLIWPGNGVQNRIKELFRGGMFMVREKL